MSIKENRKKNHPRGGNSFSDLAELKNVIQSEDLPADILNSIPNDDDEDEILMDERLNHAFQNFEKITHCHAVSDGVQEISFIIGDSEIIIPNDEGEARNSAIEAVNELLMKGEEIMKETKSVLDQVIADVGSAEEAQQPETSKPEEKVKQAMGTEEKALAFTAAKAVGLTLLDLLTFPIGIKKAATLFEPQPQ